MPRFQAIFAILLLLASLSLAVTPAKIPPNGKGRGFLSNLNNLDKVYPIPTGDWLTSSYCYCHSPVREPEEWRYEKAHIFQHEYYNYHSNVTFVAQHLCLARAGIEEDQCVRPNMDRDNMDWYRPFPMGQRDYICKTFDRTEEEIIAQSSTKKGKRFAPHFPSPGICKQHCDEGPFAEPKEESSHRKHDNVCFTVGSNNFFGVTEMGIKFNHQKRAMRNGHQAGRLKSDYMEVQEFCEDMCQKEFQMPVDMDIRDPRAMGGSRQFIYTDMDDMCDHCK